MVYMMVQHQVTLHLSNVTFYKFGRHGFIKSMPAKRLTDPPPWWWYLLCVCAVCCGLLVWPLSCVVCKQVPKHNPKVRLCALLCGTHRLAPYRLSCSATAVFLVYRVFAATFLGLGLDPVLGPSAFEAIIFLFVVTQTIAPLEKIVNAVVVVAFSSFTALGQEIIKDSMASKLNGMMFSPCASCTTDEICYQSW